MIKIVFTSLCLTSSLTLASAQVKLSFNPEVGAKYEHQTEHVLNDKQIVGARSLPIEEKVTKSYVLDIKGKDAKGVEIQFTWQHISLLMNSPMGKWGYDTKKPNETSSELDNIHGRIFNSVIGKSFIVSIAPDGSVNSIVGVDAIAEGIKQAVVADGDMGAKLSASIIEEHFTESAIKEMIEQSWKIYPANNVKQDDDWNIKNRWGEIANWNTTYILKDITNNVANITAEATVEVEPPGGIEGKLTGTQSGTLQLNINSGVLIGSNSMQNAKGNVKMRSMGMDMVVERVVKTTTTTKEIQ